ncbi:MAG TPA: TetR/AcrR family transcriptional regulator [Gemmatimonadaceae bacterium]|nr:TetR/AcrR family transcriptional regulator [Gemmatimonadaceae bacterium]
MRAEDGEDCRAERIIVAALQVFGERGLAAARVDEIARRAGVSKSTLYLHFPSKRVLFRDAIRSAVLAAVEATLPARPPGALPASARERLADYAAHAWEQMTRSEFAAAHRLTLGEGAAFPELAHLYASELVARALGRVEEIIREGVAHGEFRELEPRMAARVFLSTLMTQAYWCATPAIYVGVTGHDPSRVHEHTIELLLQAVEA